MIDYILDKEQNLLKVTYSGTIHAQDLVQFGKMISKDVSIPRKIRILTDGRDAKMCMSQKDLPEITEALAENLKEFDFVKAAYIYDKPRETALSLLVDHTVKNTNYEHRVFSTVEAAIFWLNL